MSSFNWYDQLHLQRIMRNLEADIEVGVMEACRCICAVDFAFECQMANASKLADYGVVTTWNLMLTSSATMPVSFQSPSPMLNASRLIGKTPSKT
jgi:hypothetical protein